MILKNDNMTIEIKTGIMIPTIEHKNKVFQKCARNVIHSAVINAGLTIYYRLFQIEMMYYAVTRKSLTYSYTPLLVGKAHETRENLKIIKYFG